jgi:hypothetical protein
MPTVFSSAHQAFHAVGPFNAQHPINLNSGTITNDNRNVTKNATNNYYGAAPTSNATPSSALEQEDFANKVAEKVAATLEQNIDKIDSKLEATQQTLCNKLSEQVSLTKLLYEFLTTTGQVSPLSLFMTIAMHTHYDDESHRLFCLLNIFLLLQKKRGGTSHDEEDEEDHDRSRLLLAVFLLVKMIRPQFPNLARPFFSKGFTSSKASPRTGSLTRRTFWRTSKICTGCPRRSRL